MAMQVVEDTRSTRGRWSTFVRSVFFVLLCAVILATVSPLTAKLPERWVPLASGLCASLAAFGLTVLFVHRETLRLKDAGAAFQFRSVPRFVFGFSIGLGLVVIYSLAMIPGGHVHFARAEAVDVRTGFVMLAGCVALACREELAFHGYALRRLESGFGLWTAQIVIALLFALEHVAGGVSWMHAIFGAAVGSLLFGMAALATGGLAIPIGIHAAWNFGQWALGEKNAPGIWKMTVSAGFERQTDLAASFSYVVIMTAATLLFWTLWRRSHRAIVILKS